MNDAWTPHSSLTLTLEHYCHCQTYGSTLYIISIIYNMSCSDT